MITLVIILYRDNSLVRAYCFFFVEYANMSNYFVGLESVVNAFSYSANSIEFLLFIGTIFYEEYTSELDLTLSSESFYCSRGDLKN